MSNETYLTQYHYVYRITNVILKKHYYGSRTSRIIPQLDLGVKYFSSSSDKHFRQDQRNNPQNYRYKVIRLFKTSKNAMDFEIRLHNKFNVDSNESFYNKVKQSSSCIDTTNKVNVKDVNGNTLMVNLNDQRYISGELVAIAKGYVTVKDTNTDKTFRVSTCDPRYLSGELVGVCKGMTPAKNVNGDYIYTSKDDPRFLAGEIYGIWLGRRHDENSIRKMKQTYKNNPHQQGTKNSNHGTVWVSYPEFGLYKKVKKDLINLYYEQGWRISRKIPKTPKPSTKEVEKAEFIKNLEFLHDMYTTNTWEDFKKITGYPYSRPNLVMLFHRHIEKFIPQNGKRRIKSTN